MIIITYTASHAAWIAFAISTSEYSSFANSETEESDVCAADTKDAVLATTASCTDGSLSCSKTADGEVVSCSRTFDLRRSTCSLKKNCTYTAHHATILFPTQSCPVHLASVVRVYEHVDLHATCTTSCRLNARQASHLMAGTRHIIHSNGEKCFETMVMSDESNSRCANLRPPCPLPLCLSVVSVSVCLSVCLSIFPSFCLPACACLSLSLTTHLDTMGGNADGHSDVRHLPCEKDTKCFRSWQKLRSVARQKLFVFDWG